MEQHIEQQMLANPFQNQAPRQTRFYYGPEAQNIVGTCLQAVAKKVLVLYGKETLRELNWYRQLILSLEYARISYVEYGEIRHGTELSQIEDCIALCKREQIDYILAVGGGSVIDMAKAVALGAVTEEDIWSYFTTQQNPSAALPVSVLLTLPGSGSENNDRAMLTNEDTMRKLCCRSPLLQPQYCFVNPQIFHTVGAKQLAYAVVMILNRLIGDYLLMQQQNQQHMVSRQEARIGTLLRKARVLMERRDNDAAWLELVLLDSQTSGSSWSEQEEDCCQQMAAELSAMYGVAHGAVLAVLLPAWLRYISTGHPKECLGLSRLFANTEETQTVEQQIDAGVTALEQFLGELGLQDNLCALGIQAFCFKNAAQVCTGYGWGQEQPFGAVQKLYWQDLYWIYKSVYKKQGQTA